MSEVNRLHALMKYRILDTPPEMAFDEITAFAADVCGTQRAFINLVDGSRMWVKSAYGSDTKECDRPLSFCGVAIEGVEALVINDLLLDPRFAENPFVVGGPKTRFYAGVPLVTPAGAAIGTLCVCDSRPMSLTSFQVRSIERLARQVIQLLEARLKVQSQADTSEIFALLSAVAVSANESDDPQVGIQKCLDEVCRYVSAPIGHYFSVQSGQLISSGIWSIQNTAYYEPFRLLTDKIAYSKGDGLPGQTLETMAASWASDISVFVSQFERARLAYSLGVRSAFMFPVLVKAEVVGVFEFFLPTSFEPDTRFLNLMDQVAWQISRMIERANAEDALGKQTEFLNAVLENLADGVVACNAEGKLNLFNRATREFHGIGPDEGLDPEKWSAHYKLFHEDGETLLLKNEIPLVRAFNEEPLRNAEIVIESGDGVKRDILASGRAIYDRSGRKMGAVCTMQDITEAKSANRRLETSSKRFESLVETSPVGIFLMDQNCKTLLWNPGCEKLFGWTKEEALGRTVPFFSPQAHAAVTRLIRENAILREKVTQDVVEKTKDGREVAIQYSCVPLMNEENQVTDYLTVVVDITDIKQRELNILESNRALRAATVAKSEFLANMSHEIRTPLNGVIGIAELLLDSELTEEQREYMRLLQTSAENLLTIISDILDFSKVEAGKLDIENVNFDFESIVGEVHRALELPAKAKNLLLSRSVSGEMSTRYMGDPGRIRQVITNLVNNAIKFTKSGVVSTSLNTKSVDGNRTEIRVEVTDSGMGIADETVERLFKPFSQADSSTTREFGGTGLGLSICKRLIELMGGTIGVESQLGKGSTFWFVLTLENAPKEVIRKLEKATDTSMPVKKGMKILVAEDNSTNQMITVEMLSRLGLRADLVENGKAVLEALRTQHYDLVLMDCHMPEMDGYEASHLIRKSTAPEQSDVTIIAMTANAMKGDREKCLAAGMDDYVTKPVKIEDLEKAIHRNMKKTSMGIA